MKNTKLFLMLITLLAALVLSACGSTPESPAEDAVSTNDTAATPATSEETTSDTSTTEQGKLIGISMPTKSS